MPRHPHPPRSVHGGRHELGQNDLHDPRVVESVLWLVRRTRGPVVELGAGLGALTTGLADLGRPLHAVELDEHRVAALRRSLPPHVEVVHADAVGYRLPPRTRVVVGNLPFHVTTPVLRGLLDAPGWQDAVLLVQWEVARKRAGVGGGTMLTAQVAPWFETRLERRVPASAFRPRPSVDGGVLAISRRAEPLVDPRERRAYTGFVRSVFGGCGRGIAEVVARAAHVRTATARTWCAAVDLDPRALPRDVAPRQWAGLWHARRGG